MLQTSYMKSRLLIAFLCCFAFLSELQAQGRIKVYVTQVEVTQNEDCDNPWWPLPNTESDFVFEYKAEDGQGNTNNNPVFAGGLLSGSKNHAYKDNDNGPYSGTPAAPNGITFNPGNGVFFDYKYACTLPTQIDIEWMGYENDEASTIGLTNLLTEGRTGVQNATLTVPTTPGLGAPQTYTATGQSGCAQTFRITFQLELLPVNVTVMEDSICNALLIPVNNTTQLYAWCGNKTMEPGEPETGNMSAHGSAWFYFVAPPSGQVKIETDVSETELGTELVVYHAADGHGCVHGTNNWTGFTGTNPVKNKFQYLSYQGDADDDIFIVSPSAPATAHFSDVLTAAPAIRDGHALIAGEVYYIQLTTDDNNQNGFIGIRIEDRGGSPFNGVDIPCQGTDISTDAQSPIVRTEANGAPESTQLTTSNVSDEETSPPFAGTTASDYAAYIYNTTTSNGLNGSMWFQFTAANSGRVHLEADLDAGFVNETENLVFYAPDNRFAPGLPSDFFCSNITQVEDAEGGTGVLGAKKAAIIDQRCLEPGYTYYGMVDPQSANLAGEAEVWAYDPSNDDPAYNAPKNDILCLALQDSLFEIPVKPANQTIPFSAVAGTNQNACIEQLAGEPVSNPATANRADQTVWHYFIAPPSGVVEMKIRAYIGLDSINYAVYELLNGTDCYGGLNPATFTQDGTQTTNTITPMASGYTDFNGDVVGLCCLIPGRTYAIQLDGGHPGDEGQYIIEYINEIEVYAGDAQVSVNNDTTNFNDNDTVLVCFSDTLVPSVMLDILGQSTSVFPNCMDLGYAIHDSLNIPDSIINGNFTYIDTVYQRGHFWTNNNTNVLVSRNTVHYVSPMADEMATWGQLICPSASIENAVPFVFLTEVTTTQGYNPASCVISFSATGGVPAYNGSQFNWIITNSLNDTMAVGTLANGASQNYSVPVADTYTVVFTDSLGCGASLTVNATPCNDPCKNNPVVISPNPVDSTVYTCYPGGDSAMATILIDGGEPSITAGSNYTITVTGSSAPSIATSYTLAHNGAATPFSFSVMDNDNWQVVVEDANGCTDTLNALFTYDLVNCPDYCNINPVVSTFDYKCNTDGSALVQVNVGGGQGAIDGSNYSINTSGSTIFGQNFNNAQLAGQIGGQSNFSFVINDGDNWQVIITDINGCADTITDGYLFDTAHCPICTMLPVSILPSPIDSSVYACNPDGSAEVSIYLSGGAPFINGTGSFNVNVNGSTVTGQNGTTTANPGVFKFTVDDGDNWTVIATDTNTCADTATGTFNYNTSNCPDFCLQNPITFGPYSYICNGDGSASVTMTIGGGRAALDGSNYTVNISGSTNGGNVTNSAVAGTINGTATLTFNVNDTDTWTVDVTDTEGCNANTSATYNFNATNCPNICTLLGIDVDTVNVTCYTDRTADITLQISGGQPNFDGSDYLVTIIGSSTGSVYQRTVTGTINNPTDFVFSVADGDSWTAYITDGNCEDSIKGSFIFSPATCNNLCQDSLYQPVLINGGTNAYTYTCNQDNNTAVLNLEVTGGFPLITQGRADYVANVTINGASNQYLVNSDGNTATLSVNLNDGDNWSVIVYDALGCEQDTLQGVFTTVTANATTDATETLLLGQVASLNGAESTGNNINYSWTPSANVDNPTVAVTSVQPLLTTTYTLNVSDNFGCTASDSVTVSVGPCVPVSAGFTPNKDAVNDTWEIPCLSLYDNVVKVYNRWGQLVFEASNYDNTWDGTANGTDLPDATYYYVIEVDFPQYENPVVYKGTVTIIR